MNVHKQRNDAFSARDAIPVAERDNMSAVIIRRFLHDVPLPPRGSVISGYHAVNSEVVVEPLLLQLHAMGYICALPQVFDSENRVTFRVWTPDTPMQTNIYGMQEPHPAHAREVLPDLLIVPGLAFDRRGFRLGHGSGHFDRTFAFMKQARHEFVAVALAFDMQIIEKVITTPYDYPMDFIVTEKRLYKKED